MTIGRVGGSAASLRYLHHHRTPAQVLTAVPTNTEPLSFAAVDGCTPRCRWLAPRRHRHSFRRAGGVRLRLRAGHYRCLGSGNPGLERAHRRIVGNCWAGSTPNWPSTPAGRSPAPTIGRQPGRVSAICQEVPGLGCSFTILPDAQRLYQATSAESGNHRRPRSRALVIGRHHRGLRCRTSLAGPAHRRRTTLVLSWARSVFSSQVGGNCADHLYGQP